MIKLTVDNILFLHKLIAEETGGSVGVRDYALIESAIESPYATFDGTELFPTIEEKAAKLGFSLISNHAFVDGNKRIGMCVMITFLEINNVRLTADNDSVEKIAMLVASGGRSYKDILNWICDNKIR